MLVHHPMCAAMQVAGAAARALSKLGAAALPHVHRIVTCATDMVHCLRGMNGGLWPFADALIELLPHITSAQRLQEVVTQLEEGKRPDVLLCVLAHAGEAALPFKFKIVDILSDSLISVASLADENGPPPSFPNIADSVFNGLDALQRVHSAEVQAMQSELEVRMDVKATELERVKAELEAMMETMKAELEARMDEQMSAALLEAATTHTSVAAAAPRPSSPLPSPPNPAPSALSVLSKHIKTHWPLMALLALLGSGISVRCCLKRYCR